MAESIDALAELEAITDANEEIGITDDAIISAACQLLQSGDCDGPYDALERAVLALPEPPPTLSVAPDTYTASVASMALGASVASVAPDNASEIPFFDEPKKQPKKRTKPMMKPETFKAARKKLGLSVNQMAEMLGVDPVQVRRMEIRPELGSHRPVMPTTERLVRAWLDGYRPKDWNGTG